MLDMNENRINPYVFTIIRILRTIIMVYSVYFIGLTVFNFSLKETSGKITNIHQYEKTSPPEPDGINIKINVKDIYYQYTIDGKNYTGKKISNLLIFPDFNFYKEKKITVYYSTLFPKYSILFKGNLKYSIYNAIPILILGLIVFIIKIKNNLYEYTQSNKENEIHIDEIQEISENFNNEITEMEDKFIEEIGNGEKEIKFLLILEENDGIIIGSLLNSEQIPYKIEYSSVKLHSYKNSIFHILEKDYFEALIIINGYIRNKKQDEKENIFIYKKSSTAHNER
jgi:hypothetical protein